MNYFSFKQFTVYHDKCSFKVGTDGVLLGAYADVSNAEKILDIGTGSGLIALMMAQRSDGQITAIEPHYDSYKQACSNIENSSWSKRIKVENVDLQSYCPEATRFDMIVSNPPYFIDSLKNPDPVKAAARHNVTLSSEEILKGVSRLLTDDGNLQVILPYVEGNIFISEAQAYGLFCNNILKIRPLPVSEIRRLILRFTRKRTIATEKFLTIEKGNRYEFTEEYINLTKDFYLKF
jgi:tRNA1Val (adenine37-N6)-methyltransferase